MSREDALKKAEQYVRDTFSHDMGQELDEKKVKEIAKKVARSLPRQALESA